MRGFARHGLGRQAHATLRWHGRAKWRHMVPIPLGAMGGIMDHVAVKDGDPALARTARYWEWHLPQL